MTKMDCQIIGQAAMALADGEAVSVDTEQVQLHLDECPDCRRTVGELRSLNDALATQSRRLHTVNLWPQVANRIMSESPKSAAANLAARFALLLAMLVMVRALVLTTTQPLEWAVRLIALFFVGGWFFLQRENPFVIQPDLINAKESEL
jgi:predicted anti-sigma-YlaC factor YlaD